MFAMGSALSNLQLNSPAFQSCDRIPLKHSGEGENVSPHLEWINVPEETRSFALICHDPDGPRISQGFYGFVHWIVYNIPGSATELPEGTKVYTSGLNGANTEGYRGPRPPEGHGTHHYYFWLFTLNEVLDLEPRLTLRELLERIEPCVIGMNRLVGTYER